MDKDPIVDFIFKGHTFLRHISMKAIDNCLKLKLSRIGSSTLCLIFNHAALDGKELHSQRCYEC
jgi:hypothetical protein